MRIIVTNDGIAEISPLSQMPLRNWSQSNMFPRNSPLINTWQNKNLPSIPHSVHPKKRVKPWNINLILSHKIDKSNHRSSSTFHSRNFTNFSSVDVVTSNRKNVRVNGNIPELKKEMLDWYSKDQSIPSSIVQHSSDIFGNILLKSQSTENLASKQSIFYDKKRFKIKDIIPNKSLEKLHDKIKNDLYIESHDQIVKFDTLRKSDKQKEKIEQINKDKEKEINATNSNWIQYLHEKTTVTDKFISKLNKYNDEKWSRLNKICQSIWYTKHKDENIRVSLKTKLQFTKIKEQEEFRKDLKQLKSKMITSFNHLHINEYTQRQNKDHMYDSIFNSFKKKYWDKHNNYRHWNKHNKNDKISQMEKEDDSIEVINS